MIVVISWTEWLEDLQLRRMGEATNAVAYVDAMADDRTAFVFDTDRTEWLPEQWHGYSKTQLVHIHNALGALPITAFANRDTAQQRVGLKIIAAAKELELYTFNPPTTIRDRNGHEREMLAEADAFYACAFRGQPKGFDKVECKTLDEARTAARTLYQDRAVSIYAVRAGRQTHIENYDPSEEKVEMAREARIGEFKQVRSTTHLGKIITAHQSGTTNLDAIAATVGLTADQVTAQLRSARGSNGIGHTIDKDTKVVTLAIPEGVEVFKAPAAAREPKVSTPRPLKFGEFSQVRAGSRLAKIIEACPATAEDIGTLCDTDDVIGHLKRARVSHGIDHAIADDGTVSVFAYQMPSDTILIKPAAEPRDPNAPSKPRTNKVLEAAKQGVMPTPPDFSAATHKAWRKKLETLVELAANRDVVGLRAFPINPISTSPRALDRYRNAAIAAIEAPAQAQAAE